MQTFWKIVQFTFGFILGLLLTLGIGAGIAFYILTRLAQPPAKPLFAETASPPSVEEKVVSDTAVSQEQETTQEQAETTQSEGYRTVVTWRDGLTVRSQPDVNSERLGGVFYNQQLIVLETNPEGTWQRITVPGTNLQGWVKAGNTRKID